MTENVSHISRRIICPKCGTRNLRKAIPVKSGAEYFCDKDHDYFGIAELVNVWNYDAGDFYGLDGTTQLDSLSDIFKVEFWVGHRKMMEEKNKLLASSFYEPEGEWSSGIARNESYEVVNRMLMGIEELEWDFDVRDVPCPILQTGMC